MRNRTPCNATLYQDMPFENLPHIPLGTPIAPDHALYYDLVINPPLDKHVSELGQGWCGTLIRFSEEDWEKYESCSVFHDRRFAGGVVWQLTGEEEMAVHLLTDHEHRRILRNTLSIALEEVVHHYDGERLAATAPDDPLRELFGLLRRRNSCGAGHTAASTTRVTGEPEATGDRRGQHDDAAETPAR